MPVLLQPKHLAAGAGTVRTELLKASAERLFANVASIDALTRAGDDLTLIEEVDLA
jgi:hypothetical protein